MWTVTRQLQWPDGNLVVEVSYGGLDYCNPDALAAKYEGEFKEFLDPIEAVEAAIKICMAWRKDSKKDIQIGIGSTGGFTMPFEVTSFNDARKLAKKIREEIPKCPRCGDIVDESGVFMVFDEKFCSERCASLHFEEKEVL